LIGDLLILPEEQRPKFHGNKSSKLKHDLLTLDDKNLSRQLSSHKISSIIQCTIVYNNKKLTVNCLVDTGSEQSNFASPRVAEWLNQVGASSEADQHCVVCSPINKQLCSTCKLAFKVDFYFQNIVNKKMDIIQQMPLKILHELNTSKYDIIMGLNTIYENSILKS